MTQILLDTGPSPFGWHRYETFLRCPQLYAWTYHAKEPGEDGRALAMGSLVHVGLAHHYARMRETQQGRDATAYYDPVDVLCTYMGRCKHDRLIKSRAPSDHGGRQRVPRDKNLSEPF